MIHKDCGGTIIWALAESSLVVLTHSDNEEPDGVAIDVIGTCEKCATEIDGIVYGDTDLVGE